MKEVKEKKWLLWLWLVIFPPVGIILLWRKSTMKDKKTKIILSIVFTFWFIIAIYISGNNNSNNIENDTTQTQVEETTTEIETETVPHREEAIGISNKDIESLDIDRQLTVSKVINDVTGNWRISVINKSMDFKDYALSYYKKYFKDDKEVHAIVNFTYMTTTKITVTSNMLHVMVYEYVKGEEHDAKKLFGGMPYSGYSIYLDNGDIVK